MGAYTREQVNQIEAIVFDKINIFILGNGYPPTVRELQEICGFGSSSTAHGYLVRLEKKGLIERGKDIKRAIKISGF